MVISRRSLKWIAGQSESLNVSSSQNRYKFIKNNSLPHSRTMLSSFKWDKSSSLKSPSVPASKQYSSVRNTGPNKNRSYIRSQIKYEVTKYSPVTKFEKSGLYSYVRKSNQDDKSTLCCTSDRLSHNLPRGGFTSVLRQNATTSSKPRVSIKVDSRFKYVKPGVSPPNSKSDAIGDARVVTRFSIKKVKQRTVPRSSTFHYKKIVQKAVHSLKFRRQAVCQVYCRTGKCTSKTCSFSHNKNYLRICPRFLQQNCPLGSDACPLAHVLDPCRIPQCSFYEAGNCGRPHCPYLHVRHPAKSVVCSDFAYGRCPRGRLCNKRHVWVQKSLSNKFGHQKLSRLTIAIGNTASNKTLIATELEDNTDDHHSNPIAAPAGSLRNVYPAPEFIPLMSESDDFMVNTDASCL